MQGNGPETAKHRAHFPNLALKILGTFHLSQNSSLNKNILVCRMERYFPIRPTWSHSIPAWAHFPPRVPLQNAEGY